MQYVLSENYPKIKNLPKNTIRKLSEFTFRTKDHQIHNFYPSFLTHLHTLTSNYPKTYIDYPKINRMCLATKNTGDLGAATLPPGFAAILKSTIRKSTVPKITIRKQFHYFLHFADLGESAVRHYPKTIRQNGGYFF